MDVAERRSLGNFGAWLGVGGNFGLIIIKLIAGVVGKSQGLIAEAIHSGADLLSSISALIGVKIANRPADAEHPFGHGKAEPIAATVVAFALCAAGLELAYSGIIGVIEHIDVIPDIITLWVALATVVYNGFMSTYRLHIARKINSTAILSDAMNQRVDTLACASVAIGIFGARAGFPVMDHVAAALVSLFILKVSYDLIKQSVDQLMDKTDTKSNGIIKIILENEPKVKEIESIRTRYMGSETQVEVKFQVEPNLSVKEAHDLAIYMKKKITEQLEGARDITIHFGPCEEDTDNNNKLLH